MKTNTRVVNTATIVGFDARAALTAPVIGDSDCLSNAYYCHLGNGTLGINLAQWLSSRDAQLNLGFTQVKAPFKGRISNRRADAGNLVDTTTLLTTVVQPDPIYVGFDMPEADYLGYHPQFSVREMIPDAWNHRTGQEIPGLIAP